MRATRCWLSVFLGFALLLPAAGAADKPAPVAADKKEAAAKIIAAGDITGKLVNIDDDKKSLTVELTVVYSEPDPGKINKLADLQRQMLTTRDLRQRQNLQVQLLQTQAQLYTTKKETHNVDIDTAENVVVRLQNPPPAFDDKGNPKKYTAKELKELKGSDPKLPGYTADFDSLQKDQIVNIRLAKPKQTPAPKKIVRDKDKDTENEKEPASENKPVATMVIIVADAPSK